MEPIKIYGINNQTKKMMLVQENDSKYFYFHFVCICRYMFFTNNYVTLSISTLFEDPCKYNTDNFQNASNYLTSYYRCDSNENKYNINSLLAS